MLRNRSAVASSFYGRRVSGAIRCQLSFYIAAALGSEKGETMLSSRILQGPIFILWFILAAVNTQAQTSRASSADSYLERGNQWLAKGEWDRAIADYGLAIDFEARSTIYGNRGIAKQQK